MTGGGVDALLRKRQKEKELLKDVSARLGQYVCSSKETEAERDKLYMALKLRTERDEVQILQLKAVLAQTERELCQANATVTKLRVLEKAQAADIKTLSEELMTTRGAAANLYTARSELDAAKKELMPLKSEIGGLRKAHTETRAENERLTAQLQTALTRVKALEVEVEDMEASHERAMRDVMAKKDQDIRAAYQGWLLEANDKARVCGLEAQLRKAHSDRIREDELRSREMKRDLERKTELLEQLSEKYRTTVAELGSKIQDLAARYRTNMLSWERKLDDAEALKKEYHRAMVEAQDRYRHFFDPQAFFDAELLQMKDLLEAEETRKRKHPGTSVEAANRGLGEDACPSCRPMADWEEVPKGLRAQRKAQARAVGRQQQQQADKRQKEASLTNHQGGDEEGQLAGVIEASKLEQNASDTMAKVIAESLATAARERDLRAMAGVEAEQEAVKRSLHENYGLKFWWQEQESRQPTLAPVSEEEEQQQLQAVIHQTQVEAGLVPNHKPQSSRASALSPVAEESSDVERSREEQEAAYFSSIALGEYRPPSPPPPPKASPASPPPPPPAPAQPPAPAPVPVPVAAAAPAKPQPQAEDDDDELLRRAKEMSMLTYNYEMNYREPALRIGNLEAFDDFVEPTVSEPQPPAPPAQPQAPQPPARTPPTTTKCAAPAPAPAPAPVPRAPSPLKAGKKKKNKKKANGNGGGGGDGAPAPPPQQQQRQQPQERQQPWQPQQPQQQKPQQQVPQKPKHSVAPWAKPPMAPVPQRPRTPASASPGRPPPSSLDATADDEEARLLARVKVMSLLGEVDVQQAREMTDEEIRDFLFAAQSGADDDARRVGTDDEEEKLLNQAREESMRLQAEQEGKERKETTKRALQGAGVWKIEDECEMLRLKPGQEYAVDVLRGREDNQVEWYRVCHRVRLQFQERRIVVRALQSKTGAALFKQHELDQISDCVQIAAQSVKEVLQNPEHIIQQRKEMKCHVYVDWSNIILGAQPSRDRSAGLRIRVDVGKFAALLEQDRTLHSGRVAGSNHPFYNEDWDQWRRHKYEPWIEDVSDRKVKGERNVDNHLKYHIGMELAMKQYPDPLNHVLVLATGDGNLFDQRGVESNKVCNFPEAVEACLKQSYRVELWTWQNSCSRRFYQMRKEYNQLMSIRHLDDFREYVCAVPDELRASVGLNPLQPQASSPNRRWSPSAPEFIPAAPGPAGGSGAAPLRMPQGVHVTPPGRRGMSPGQRRGTPKTTPSPPQHHQPVHTDGFHLNGFALPSPHMHPQSHLSPEGERAWMPAPAPPGLGLPNTNGFYTNGTAFDAAPQRQNGAAHTLQQPSFNGPMGFGLDAFNQTVLPVPSPATNLPTTDFSVFQTTSANGHVPSPLYGCATTQELVPEQRQEQPGFASWQASPQPVINQPSPVFQPAVNGNKTHLHLSPYSPSSPEQNGVSGYDPQPHRSPPGLSRPDVPVVQAPPDEIDPSTWF